MTDRALETRDRGLQSFGRLLELALCLAVQQRDTVINAPTIAGNLTRGGNEPSTRLSRGPCRAVTRGYPRCRLTEAKRPGKVPPPLRFVRCRAPLFQCFFNDRSRTDRSRPQRRRATPSGAATPQPARHGERLACPREGRCRSGQF